jgi:RNA polymerase sigma-70 factor (ECF subfamily)
MAAPSANRILSCISTSWSEVYKAHQGQGGEVVTAQRRLLLRYYQPIFRYLRAIVRDADAAEELTHEFVVRFLRGDFRQADPSRGRFRDLVKQALRHLAIDYWRGKRAEKERAPIPLAEDWPAAPAEADWRYSPPPRRQGAPRASGGPANRRRRPPRRRPEPALDTAEADRTFLRGWRVEMLSQAWRALAQFQEQTRCSYHTVLRLRADRPEARCAELARLAGERLGRPFSEGALRQALCRAREKFADFLVAEVARTLATSDPDAIEQELIDLNLLSYCRGPVARMRKSDSPGHTGGRGNGHAGRE